MDLFDAIFVPLRDEAEIFKRTAAGLRNAVPARGTDRPSAAATAAALEIEGKRRKNRFRRDRALAPLKSPQRVVRAVKGDALPADRRV